MKISFLFLLLLVPFMAKADEITHQLGNSGYAVRWAMQKGAASKSPEHYQNALKLQNQARDKFKHRNEAEAVSLSKQAEAEAKLALKDCK